MSSSNTAVRMEHTASDLLSHPPRELLRDLTNDDSQEVRSLRPRTTSRSRMIVTRDQGFRFFRVR